MATIFNDLWKYNLAKVVVIDVTDDYQLMQLPLPSEYYPVLAERWVPRHQLLNKLSKLDWVDGFLYDWHEKPSSDEGNWYVGVVRQEFINNCPELGRLFGE